MHTIEPLESRIAPASLNPAGNLLTYTDIDGDLVKVAFTGVTMAKANFTFNGNNFLDGDITTKQFLVEINLTGKTGAGFKLTATPQNGEGNSHADIGLIAGTNTNLGAVSVDGDVENITAGNGEAHTVGLKSFTSLSFNRHGTAAGAATVLNAGSFTIKTDLLNAMLNFTGGVKSVSIGGDIEETITAVNAGVNVSGDAGTIKIGGSVLGGSGTGEMISADSAIGTLSIGGSVIGGTANLSGTNRQIDLSSVTTVKIGGDVQGGGGTDGGLMEIQGNVGSFSIGGSLIGGTNSATGEIAVTGMAKSVTIGGSVVGNGANLFSGFLNVDGTVGAVKVGGSLVGGPGAGEGALVFGSDVSSIGIGHNVEGGDSTGSAQTQLSGAILAAGNIGSLTIGGDVVVGHVLGSGSVMRDGYIDANGTIGTLKIGGSIRGNGTNRAVINAGGEGTAGVVNAIKSLTVKGSVESASIVTGYEDDSGTYVAANTFSGIGSVAIGGDLVGSFIIVGSTTGADGIPGNSDDEAITSDGIGAIIGSVKIGGDFRGISGDNTHYFIYGPVVDKVTIGKATYTHPELTGLGISFTASGTAIVESIL